MIGAGWQIAAYGGAALIGLAQLRARMPAGGTYLASREAHAVHVVMNLCMATMVSALWTPGGRMAVSAALVATALWLAFRLATPREAGQAAGTGYHLIGVAAMIYAVGLMPAGMSMAMPMHDAPGWPARVLGWLFALDVVTTVMVGLLFPAMLRRMAAATGGAPTATITTSAIRLSAVPHVVMDLGMIAMLGPLF